MITELSETAARKFLSERHLARLGCVLDGGSPYVVPVNYLLIGDAFFLHSLPGLKIAALRKNRQACLQVDEVKNFFEWQSVIAFGDFEEITDARQRAEILEILLKGFRALTPAEAVRPNTDGGDSEIVLFRIKIRQITGRMES